MEKNTISEMIDKLYFCKYSNKEEFLFDFRLVVENMLKDEEDLLKIGKNDGNDVIMNLRTRLLIETKIEIK